MADPKTHIHYASTIGSGSAFEALVYRQPIGGHRFQGICVDKQDGFKTRGSAAAWGRRRVRELDA